MMFTGIVEAVSEIKSISKNAQGLDIIIQKPDFFNDLKIGDSVAINGCCQTVTKISENNFSVQAVFETVKLTNFNNLKPGERINLERAMLLNSRLGGHLVSGHIEGTGKICAINSQGNAKIFEVETDKNIMKYIIYKGSITVNGVSLTVCELNKNSFKVSVIPHTFKNTVFCDFKTGDEVNLEPDLIAKYVEKLMIKDDNRNSNLTLEFLKENGF